MPHLKRITAIFLSLALLVPPAQAASMYSNPRYDVPAARLMIQSQAVNATLLWTNHQSISVRDAAFYRRAAKTLLKLWRLRKWIPIPGAMNVVGEEPEDSFVGIEPVSGVPIRAHPEKPLVAVFDLHGVLLEATWREEYARAYRKLTGETLEQAKAWVESSAVNIDDRVVFQTLAIRLGRPYHEIVRTFADVKEMLNTRAIPKAKEGAYDFIEGLHRRGVEIIVVSGSRTDVAIDQLRKRGFMKFITPENVVGRDKVQRQIGTGAYRDRAIEGVAQRFPAHEMIYFNDWIGSFATVKRLGGRVFALPQSSGEENANYRRILIENKADFIMDGWKAGEKLLSLLAIDEKIQAEAKNARIPTAEHAARAVPFLFASRLEPRDGLYMEMFPDLDEISYSHHSPDGTPTPLATFPSQGLVSPIKWMAASLPRRLSNKILELWDLKRRLTFFRGIETDWDLSVDRDVWSFNVDTGHLHRVEEEEELFKRIPIRHALEIGSGGGHGTAVLAKNIPTLEELSFTDISVHALAATLRNVFRYLNPMTLLRPYHGKGLRALPAGHYDYIKVNPPYLPLMPDDPRKESDPYSGTGLIREILEVGATKLNPFNPEASIVINISSICQKDWDDYVRHYGSQWVIEPLGAPRTVPLKINMNQKWLDWLVAHRGLVRKSSPKPEEEPYEHTLQVYRLRPRHAVPEVLEKEIQSNQALVDQMTQSKGPVEEWFGMTDVRRDAKRVGIFGITANPVQNAHVDLITQALEGNVDEVVIVLAQDHVSHAKRAAEASLAERLAMLRRTFGQNPKVHVVFSKSGRYLDFLKEYRRRGYSARPVFLMGGDSVEAMPAYNTPDQLREFPAAGAEIVVYQRFGVAERLQRLWSEHTNRWPVEFTGIVSFVNHPLGFTSSTLVRVLAGDRDPLWKTLVPQAVAQVIELRKLYRTPPTTDERAKAYKEALTWITRQYRALALREMAEWLKVRPHTKARDNAQRPQSYPERAEVPDEKLSWRTRFDAYDPPKMISPQAGPYPPNQQLFNPLGRTGLAGTGALFKWGENLTADMVLTRDNPITGEKEWLAVQRRDNNRWACPGGFLDKGDDALTAGIRELQEETGAVGNFRDAKILYKGIVDDSRNADNAWISTTLYWRHLSAEEEASLVLKVSAESKDVKWLSFDDAVLDELHASHPDMVRLVKAQMGLPGTPTPSAAPPVGPPAPVSGPTIHGDIRVERAG